MLGRDWVQVVVVVAGETRNKKKYKGERREVRGSNIPRRRRQIVDCMLCYVRQ